MPFPVDPLVVKIEIAFGADLKANPLTWVYVDVTADWKPDRALAATIGRADATSKAQPGKLSFWLGNPNGDYTKGNPMGAHWPYIRKNTPVRVTLDPGTGSLRVYEMYATTFIPRWGSSGDSGRQPLVQVVANGVRRRLTQGSSPLRSALYRALSGSNPIAWWPLEDGVDATQAASGLVGGPPMTVNSGIMDFVDAGPVGSAGSAQPQLDGENSLTAQITGASSTAWQVSVWARGLTNGPGTAYYVPLLIQTDNGKIYTLAVEAETTANVLFGRLESPTAAAFSEFVSTGNPQPTPIDGNWHLLQATASQSGPNIVVSLWYDGNFVATETWTGKTIGQPIRISSIGRLGEGADLTLNMKEMAVSHIAVHNTTTLVPQYQAGLGYAGETVFNRLTRLGAEQGVAMSVSAAATTKMGPQRLGPFVGLLDECQEADGGILLDGLNPGFTYLARVDAYNLPVAMTLDMDGRQFKAPFEPLDDDANIVNDETVSRVNGSSARYVDAASVAAIERYDDSKTLNVYQDSDLPGQAAWRTHLGTAGADALRFPGVGFDLYTPAGSALIEPWLTSGVRKRVRVTNPPTEYGAGPIDLLVEGYTETVRSRRVWTVAANASPYVHDVFVVGQDRIDGDGYQLAAGVSATATTLQVASTTGLLWITTAADPTAFPFDLDIAGIRVRVTGITNYLNANPYFETDLSDWVAQGAGVTIARSTAQAHQGVASLLITPPGAVASVGAQTVARYPVTAGVAYTASAWVYCPTAWADVRASIDWYDAGATFISSGLGSATSVPAAAWTRLSQTLTAPANAAQAVLRVRLGSTPGATILCYVDEVMITTPNVQAVTVQRALDGFDKTLPAGSPVGLWKPAVIGL